MGAGHAESPGKATPQPRTVFPHQNQQNVARHSSSLRVVSKHVNIASDFYILFFFFGQTIRHAES